MHIRDGTTDYLKVTDPSTLSDMALTLGHLNADFTVTFALMLDNIPDDDVFQMTMCIGIFSIKPLLKPTIPPECIEEVMVSM